MQSSTSPRWLHAADAHLGDLRSVLDQRTDAADCPHAARLLNDVPVYDCESLRARLSQGGDFQRSLMGEWAWVWEEGPGILVLQGALAAPVVDAVTVRFKEIIERERSNNSGGDHFAKAGANDRVWNALEKLCLADPASFARYYANDMLALASEAWLGPAYQITSQVNNVRPGGPAQTPHRDYHLGFCSAEQAERYPAHVHRLSPMLTLQGAVAHVDMPLESGPTLYLPHSQKYSHGYLVADREEFRDALRPAPRAVAPGQGRRGVLQPRAAARRGRQPFGRHPAHGQPAAGVVGLRPRHGIGGPRPHDAGPVPGTSLARETEAVLDRTAQDRAVAASAEGYAFPTNLDRDPPLGGLAPDSPQAVVRRALQEGWSPDRLSAWMDTAAHKRLT